MNLLNDPEYQRLVDRRNEAVAYYHRAAYMASGMESLRRRYFESRMRDHERDFSERSQSVRIYVAETTGDWIVQ